MINEAESMAEQASGALGIIFVQKAYAYLLPNEAKISSLLRGRSRRTSTVAAFQFRYRRWRLDSLEVERRSVVEKHMLPMAWSLQTAPDEGPYARSTHHCKNAVVSGWGYLSGGLLWVVLYWCKSDIVVDRICKFISASFAATSVLVPIRCYKSGVADCTT
jgi:hypothetical protein